MTPPDRACGSLSQTVHPLSKEGGGGGSGRGYGNFQHCHFGLGRNTNVLHSGRRASRVVFFFFFLSSCKSLEACSVARGLNEDARNVVF